MPYLRPGALSDALACLAGGEHLVLAGGTDIYPAAVGRTPEGPLLDITGIGELSGITRADGVPPLMVLDAEVEFASAAGRRRLPLAAFLTGARRTARRPDEILTAVLVPEAAQAGRSAFVKLGARRHLVISVAMVAARLTVAEGIVRAAALAVGACGPVATRLPAVEARLVGAAAGPGLAGRIDPAEVAAGLAPIGDVRASADYRAEAAAELLRRAVAGLAA